MSDNKKLQELQTKLVISYLMRDKKISFGEASRIWYNSKTKKRLQGTSDDYSYVEPTRCYDELLMELNKNPYWMKGSFE